MFEREKATGQITVPLYASVHRAFLDNYKKTGDSGMKIVNEALFYYFAKKNDEKLLGKRTENREWKLPVMVEKRERDEGFEGELINRKY